MAKMDKKWVILCSSAVAAVYASGYFTTQTQAANIQPRQHAQFNIQTNNKQPYSSQPNNNQTDSSQPNNNQSNSTAANSSSQTNSKYKDGTYQGTGMNRRGSIEVTVTIKSDKITDVEISNWGMHYDESDVDGLPAEVVQDQSAQVQNVSGATYSTEAFQEAVQDALSQAENA